MSYQQTAIRIAKILGRFLIVFWGFITIMPALMASDSGTDVAVAEAYTLLSASLYFILSGVFAKWSLFAAAWFAFITCFIPFQEKFHYFLLRTLVPLVMVLAFLFAFGWIGPRDDPASDADMLHPLENATNLEVVNMADDDKSSSQYRDAPGMV